MKKIDTYSDTWCVIPVFNNSKTIVKLIKQTTKYLANILVVDDGSSDANLQQLLKNENIHIISHPKNLGKGKAILTAMKYIDRHNGKFMITMDGDGQHYPHDLPKFLQLLKSRNDGFIIIGNRNLNTQNVPNKSRFGRNFANFWLRIETGCKVKDCQSGFRAYPIKQLKQLKFYGKGYTFEAEVLAKAAWAGLNFKHVNIDVHYPKPTERITSFKPIKDNFRLSIMHTYLVIYSLIPFVHKKLIKRPSPIPSPLKHPITFLKYFLTENNTPAGLATAAFVGIIIATLPIFFFHTIVIIYFATRLHLNKILAINIQHICIPPIVPAICIEIGHYLKHDKFLTNITFTQIFKEAPTLFGEWLLGSLILAPILATIVATIVYLIANLLQKNKKEI